MKWADHYIRQLNGGETVSFRPRGNSMSGRIESGQLVTVVPSAGRLPPLVGDIVLCTVFGSQYLHLVKAVDGDRYQIGNNKGRINGWTRRIHGLVISVEP